MIKFKMMVAAAMISMFSVSGMKAEDVLVEAPRVAAPAAVEKQDEAKKVPTGMDKFKAGVGAIAGNMDVIKKDGAEIVESFKSSKQVYDELIANHKGDLRWYHKAWYGIQAFGGAIVNGVVSVVKNVVIPAVNAVSALSK